MLMIELSRAFRKDYRRVISNPAHARDIPKAYESAVSMLVAGVPLPDHFKDHPLLGEWRGYRECHLKPDVLLIYRKTKDGILRIARLGSHAELFS